MPGKDDPMNPPNLGPAITPSTPLGPSGAQEEGASDSGISGFAVLVGMSFLLLVAFFALSLVAVWKRSEADSSRPVLVPVVLSGSVPPLPVPVVPQGWRKATVTVPRIDMKHGVLRVEPGFDTPTAALVPRGTTVDVGPARTKAGQTWYRVKAELDGRVYEGWMHSDILVWVP